MAWTWMGGKECYGDAMRLALCHEAWQDQMACMEPGKKHGAPSVYDCPFTREGVTVVRNMPVLLSSSWKRELNILI